MNLSELHRRLLADVLAIGTVYPRVITGGYDPGGVRVLQAYAQVGD